MVLQDVVVVGYGVQKKSVVTAAISSITSENLKQQSHDRIDAVLQGMTSGVYVTQASGAPMLPPKSASAVGTINSSNPLYIVDGLAISGGIDYLNPNDIERIRCSRTQPPALSTAPAPPAVSSWSPPRRAWPARPGGIRRLLRLAKSLAETPGAQRH